MVRFIRASDKTDGLDHLMQLVVRSLLEGRHIYACAAKVFLGESTQDEMRDEVYAVERRILDLERQISREIVLYATVHGQKDLERGVRFVGILKDAARIGEISMSLYQLAALGGEARDPDFYGMRDELALSMREAQAIFIEENETRAQKFFEKADLFEDRCESKIAALIAEDEAPASALWCRANQRVMALLVRVLATLFQPIEDASGQDDWPV
ncbi:MAG: hypothetical protein AAGD14_08105 [Planctomycetota bacterium]